MASGAGAAGRVWYLARSFLVLVPVTVVFGLARSACVTRTAVLRLESADAIADFRGWYWRLRGWFHFEQP